MTPSTYRTAEEYSQIQQDVQDTLLQNGYYIPLEQVGKAVAQIIPNADRVIPPLPAAETREQTATLQVLKSKVLKAIRDTPPSTDPDPLSQHEPEPLIPPEIAPSHRYRLLPAAYWKRDPNCGSAHSRLSYRNSDPIAPAFGSQHGLCTLHLRYYSQSPPPKTAEGNGNCLAQAGIARFRNESGIHPVYRSYLSDVIAINGRKPVSVWKVCQSRQSAGNNPHQAMEQAISAALENIAVTTGAPLNTDADRILAEAVKMLAGTERITYPVLQEPVWRPDLQEYLNAEIMGMPTAYDVATMEYKAKHGIRGLYHRITPERVCENHPHADRFAKMNPRNNEVIIRLDRRTGEYHCKFGKRIPKYVRNRVMLNPTKANLVYREKADINRFDTIILPRLQSGGTNV